MSTGLDFTTLARVKALIGESTTNQDPLLQALITAVSARIEDEMQRKAKKQAYTDVYTLNEGNRIVMLRAAPVDVATPPVVKVSGTADFASSTALVVNQGYTVDPFSSLVRFYTEWMAPRRASSNSPAGPLFIQIVYTGGMAQDTSTFVTTYPDLAQAADLQVAYIHKRRLTPGGNITVGQGSTSFQGEYGLLKEVQSLVARHRRVNWY